MRKLFILLLAICLTSMVYAQKKTANTAEKKTETKAETKKEVKTDSKTNGKTEEKLDKKDSSADQPKTDSKTEKIPEGYGSLVWGMYVSEAKDKITGILTYTDEKKVIVSKDGDIQYYYGFFYKEPVAEKKETIPAEVKDSKNADKKDIKKEETVPGKETPAKEEKKEPDQEKDEGRLFYVSINFPYLDKEKVYEKIQKRYGKHTGENLKDDQGAMAWDSENTVIIMWIDQYKKKPFCRKIIYISKKISNELNEYTHSILNKTELEIYKKIKNP